MSEKIEPALTAFQWSTVRTENGVISVTPTPGMTEDPNWMTRLSTDRARQYIAIANAAIPDSDPRKITREKITLLRRGADEMRANAVEDWITAIDELELFADALESYLPPK